MVLHLRCVLERRERNPGLRESLMELCLRGRLFGVHPKSHNASYWLGMGRLMSI